MKKTICSIFLFAVLAFCLALLIGSVYLYATLPEEPPILDPDEPLPFLMLHDSFYLLVYIISLALILVGFLLLFVFHKTMMFYICYVAAAIIAGITSRDGNFLVIFPTMVVIFLASIFCVKNGGYDY